MEGTQPNMTIQFNVIQNFFEPLWAKALAFSSFLIIETVGNFLLAFIVWYTWSTSQELTRTLVTQLHAQVQTIVFAYSAWFSQSSA